MGDIILNQLQKNINIFRQINHFNLFILINCYVQAHRNLWGCISPYPELSKLSKYY
jgi:hypothetical protein